VVIRLDHKPDGHPCAELKNPMEGGVMVLHANHPEDQLVQRLANKFDRRNPHEQVQPTQLGSQLG
jgi:hypothetical protein